MKLQIIAYYFSLNFLGFISQLNHNDRLKTDDRNIRLHMAKKRREHQGKNNDLGGSTNLDANLKPDHELGMNSSLHNTESCTKLSVGRGKVAIIGDSTANHIGTLNPCCIIRRYAYMFI